MWRRRPRKARSGTRMQARQRVSGASRASSAGGARREGSPPWEDIDARGRGLSDAKGPGACALALRDNRPMRSSHTVGALVGGLVLALVALLALPSLAGAAPVETRPVVFTVQNVNRSQVPCSTDGGTYHVRGLLVGP